MPDRLNLFVELSEQRNMDIEEREVGKDAIDLIDHPYLLVARFLFFLSNGNKIWYFEANSKECLGWIGVP